MFQLEKILVFLPGFDPISIQMIDFHKFNNLFGKTSPMELHAKNTPILPRKYNSIFHNNHLSRIVKVTVCVDFLGTFHHTNVMAHRLTFDEGV